MGPPGGPASGFASLTWIEGIISIFHIVYDIYDMYIYMHVY